MVTAVEFMGLQLQKEDVLVDSPTHLNVESYFCYVLYNWNTISIMNGKPYYL